MAVLSSIQAQINANKNLLIQVKYTEIWWLQEIAALQRIIVQIFEKTFLYL